MRWGPGRSRGGFSFLGLVGLRDPVRGEAASAITDAASAGIRVVMVTGDHAGTAASVGRDVGLLGPEEGRRRERSASARLDRSRRRQRLRASCRRTSSTSSARTRTAARSWRSPATG